MSMRRDKACTGKNNLPPRIPRTMQEVRGKAWIFELFLILVLIGCISQNRQFSVLGLNPQIIFKNGPVVFC